MGSWRRLWHEVPLVARGAHLEAIRSKGLTLIAGEERGTHPVGASARPEGFGVQDAVFITLKAYSIPSLLSAMGALVGPDTVVMPAFRRSIVLRVEPRRRPAGK